jgi:hypothetical protein
MSSASLTERKPTRVAPEPAPPPRARRELPLLAILPLGTTVGAAVYMFAVIGAKWGAGTFFLLLGAGAFGLVVVQIWKSVAATLDDAQADPSEAAGRALGAHRRELEREKQLILKAIKELEFDYAMGKISEADYNEAHATYRKRAVRILAQLDAGGASYREVIERELAERLARREPGGAAPPAAKIAAAAAGPEPAVHPGCRCGTQNDADAAFCKKCGQRLETPS